MRRLASRLNRHLIAGWLFPTMAAACLGVGLMSSATAQNAAKQVEQRVRFAVIGDLPYKSHDERNLIDVLQNIGNSDSVFVIHLGDIKSGSEFCGDDLLNHRIQLLEQSTKPLIYTPGDNEWTDCHRRNAGGFDPVERLKWLRQRAFAQPRSLGKNTIGVQQQASGVDGPSENLRWQHGPVLFATFNVPGSNNNDWAQHPAEHPRNAEFASRKAHNEAWLKDLAVRASDSSVRALVLAFQGNPFERDSAEQQSHLRDGFAEWRSLLAAELQALGKPALLIHGDTHSFRYDQVLRSSDGKLVGNVRRLEAFGYPFTRNWVEVTVDPGQPQAFVITPRRLLQTDSADNN